MSGIQNIVYPVLQFRSKSVIAYNEYLYPRSGAHRSVLSESIKRVRESHKSYSGTITSGAKKRLTKAISLLVQSTKTREIKNPITRKYQSFKLSFITLTIPQCNVLPDAKFCNKNLLEPMLRVLRRRYHMKNYVWKLELQRNGMVHYHLTSNVFINHVTLKEEWNKILDRNDLLNDYRSRTGNVFPNSTDIKSVRNIRNLEAYLVKYVTKESQNSKAVNTKIWDCSLALKKSSYFSIESNWTYADRLNSLEQQGSVQSYAGDRYVIFRFKNNPVFEVLCEEQRRKYYIHLNHVRNGTKENNASTITNVLTQTVSDNRQPIGKVKAAIQFRLFEHSIATGKPPKRFSEARTGI